MAIPNPFATGLPNVNVVTIAQDTWPSYNLTGTTSSLQLWACTIPGGTIGPNDMIEISMLWTCNSSAGTKQVNFDLDGTALIADIRTTSFGTMQHWYITPFDRSTGTQNQFNAPFPSQLTGAGTTVTTDMTKDQYLGLWGALSNGADNLQVQYVSVRVWQDRTPAAFLYSGQKKKLMYGVNGHYNYSQTPAQMIQSCKTLGCTVYRVAWEGPVSLPSLLALAQAFQGSGISLYVLIDYALEDPSGNLYPDEATAYAQGYSVGYYVASQLAPYGVTLFECGNELDTKFNINPTASTGQLLTDFNGTINGQPVFPILRGCMRGCIDGVHAAGSQCLAGSNAFTICGYGCMDGLWYGYAPDGTSGHPPVSWDFTAFHNYRIYGSLLSLTGNFSSNSWVNMLEKMWRNYGKPIFISEFNGNSSDTDAQRAQWVGQEMSRYLSHRNQYGVQGWFIYSAYDSPFSVLTNPTTLVSTLGTTFANFIAANPDPGT